MTNQIKIDLSLSGEHATARGLEHVGDRAEGAGDDFQKMARDAGFLDKRIGELRGELKGLMAEFNRTGDLDLMKKINAGNRSLGQFTKLRQQFSDLFEEVGTDAVKAGATVGVKMGESIMSQAATALAGSKAILIGAAAGMGAVLSPFLGGVVASAVLGGAGIGGIIGGVALAAQDARVQDAGKSLGEHLAKSFQAAGEPFIAPTIKVLEELRPVVDRVSGSLREGFASVAPVFLPLARGITGLVEQALPGFLKALEASKPVLRAIADELPKIGDAVGKFFEEISEDGDEAAAAFILLSKSIQGAIIKTGQLISFLSDAFELSLRAGLAVGKVMEKAFGWIPVVGDLIRDGRKDIEDTLAGMEAAKNASGDFAGSLDDVADSATEAKQKMVQLNDALAHFFGIAMNSSQATIAYERAWDEMIETLKDGKRTLDVTTEAGRENMESINSTIQAIQGMHDARVAEGMVVEESLAIRDRELEKLRAQLLQLGYNKQQVDDIINLYKIMPELASTKVEAPGAETTLAQLREILSMINAIKRGTALGALGGVQVGRRASGGPVSPGQMYLVGEDGPELLSTGASSGYVHNAGQTRAMMSGATGGATRPLVSISLTPSGNPAWDALVQAIWPSLCKQIRVEGGDLASVGAA